MGRPALLTFAALLAAAALAGCGGEGVTTPTPQTQIGKGPTAPTFPVVAAFHVKGDPSAGKGIFTSAGCTGCHTLAAAHSTGTVGPNLDQLKPDYRAVTAQVTNGGAQMPKFSGQLSTKQIADVSAFVVTSTGGKVP